MTIFLIFFFLGILGFMFLIAIPLLTIGYFSYIFFMETSHYEITFYSWLHDLIAKYIISWIPFSESHVKFVDKKAVDTHKQLMYGLHPHGLIAQGRILHMIQSSSELRPYFVKSYQGIHSGLFRIPILREILLLGRCVPAHESFMKSCIDKGYSIAIYPGGSREVKFCADTVDSNTDYLYLKKRKGFVRMALENKIPLVPVLFWEDQTRFQYVHTDLIKKLSKLIRLVTGQSVNLNIIQMLSWTNMKNLWSMLFGDTTQSVYIGKPLEFDRDNPPSVDEAHTQYIEAVQELYKYAKEEQKSQRELVIT